MKLKNRKLEKLEIVEGKMNKGYALAFCFVFLTPFSFPLGLYGRLLIGFTNKAHVIHV